MRTISLTVGCLGLLIGTAVARAANPDVVNVPANLFREFDKDRNGLLKPDELKGAIEKWKKYVRGRMGGEPLRTFETRIQEIDPDGDGDSRVSLQEFREFAAESVGIQLARPAAPAPAPAAPAAAGGGNRSDKNDRDDKADREREQRERERREREQRERERQQWERQQWERQQAMRGQNEPRNMQQPSQPRRDDGPHIPKGNNDRSPSNASNNARQPAASGNPRSPR